MALLALVLPAFFSVGFLFVAAAFMAVPAVMGATGVTRRV